MGIISIYEETMNEEVSIELNVLCEGIKASFMLFVV